MIRIPKIKLSKRLWLILISAVVVGALAGGAFWRQNVVALHELHTAQQQDKSGKTMQAKSTLAHIPSFLVLPSTRKQITAEVHHNQQLIATNQKIAEAEQLLKEHKTSQALALLNTLPQGTAGVSAQTQQQVDALKNTIQKTTTPSSSSSTTTKTTKSGGGSTTSGGGSSSGSGGSSGGSGGGSGGSGGTPPPPSPMSSISVTNFSVTSSAHNASSCTINQSVSFSTNGTGSVSVTWRVISTKTSSEINNPVTYSFNAAGTQTDTTSVFAQGLESGDSYHVSVTIVDQANGSVSATGGPATISSCAAPPALLASQQPSFMTTITPGTVGVSQSQDGIFTNECSVALTTPFSVNSSGSVQAVYTITSGSSGGATVYAINTEDFTASGSDTDHTYTRLPHLNSGDVYSVTVRLIDVGNQSVYATSGPVTSGCA